LNKLVEALRSDRPAFGAFILNGDIQQAIAVGDSDYDFAMIEMEHQGFDFTELRTTLQWMVHRGRPMNQSPSPLVRVPPTGSDRNDWVVKQTLDAGAAGVITPRLESADEALHMVLSARYPPRRDAKHPGPGGHRGYAPLLAPRSWGIDVVEYMQRADVWPLDPDGDLVLMPLIESAKGVENIEEIVKVPGIGAVLLGEADLSLSLGLDFPGGLGDASLVEAREHVLKACRGAGVKVACLASADDVWKRLGMGFEIFVGDPAMVAAGRAALSGS